MQKDQKKIKKLLFNFLKIAVTFGGLYLAYGKFDWSQLRGNTEKIEWGLFFLALITNMATTLSNTFRFKLITTNRIKFWDLAKINFTARFFSLFLPTSLGGDVIRTVRLSKYTDSGSKSLSIVFIDRFIGMSAMILLGTFMYLLPLMDKSQLESWIILVMIGTFLFVCVVWLFIWVDMLSNFAFKIIKLIPVKIVREKLDELYKDILSIRQIPINQTLKALGLSLFSQLITSISGYLVSRALNLGIDISVFFVTVPVISTLLLVPISINGIGVRDYLYKTIYAPLTQSTNFILLAPMAFLLTLIAGAIGGIIYLLDDKDQNNNNIKDYKESPRNL